MRRLPTRVVRKPSREVIKRQWRDIELGNFSCSSKLNSKNTDSFFFFSFFLPSLLKN